MQHYIGPKGFTIYKSSITPQQQQQQIKNDLMAKSAMQYQIGNEIKTFPVYRESTRKLYIPRFYGIEKINKPEHYTIKEGDDIHIHFQDYSNKEH